VVTRPSKSSATSVKAQEEKMYKCAHCNEWISSTYNANRDEFVPIGHKDDCPTVKDRKENSSGRYWDSKLGRYEDY
jgi:hypothetical protein